MSRRIDKEQDTMDPRIRDETVSLGGELFAEVGGVLIFDLSVGEGGGGI